MSDNTYTAPNRGSTPEEALTNMAEGLQTIATGAMEVFSALYDLLDLSSRANKVKPDDTAPVNTPTGITVPADMSAADLQPEKQGSDDRLNQPRLTIMPDDITKAAVTLIKRDRKNSQRIQALLQTYGVSQMSALDPAKYETFMVDLQALGNG